MPPSSVPDSRSTGVDGVPVVRAETVPPEQISAGDLMRTFAMMGLYGFGGVMPWARRAMVDEKHWVDDRGFAELLAMGQILPGPNIMNVASIFGYRCAGWRGAAAALIGLTSIPFVIVMTLGILYVRYGGAPLIQGALRGMTAVAAGLVLTTGLKLAKSQPRTLRALVFGVAAWVAIGLLRWPMGWVMLTLIPSALATEWFMWSR
jgi:chromate transporter